MFKMYDYYVKVRIDDIDFRDRDYYFVSIVSGVLDRVFNKFFSKSIVKVIEILEESEEVEDFNINNAG